jgi:signal recognition particle subunit SRP54
MLALFGETTGGLTPTQQSPRVVLMLGLQGSGKTTTSAKLARWLEKQGRHPMLVSTDVRRPAAIEQLSVLAAQIGARVHDPAGEMDPVARATGALTATRNLGFDTLIVDTAGRLHIADDLMQELEAIKAAVQPADLLYVADAMTGQDAVKSAGEFNHRIGTTGVVLTKMDGDARGGAALSIRHVTGQPLKFVGVGEKFDALELFYPERAASRILGMGDMLSFIEKAEQAIDKKQQVEMQRKLIENEFTLEDFRDQIRQLRKLGPLESVLSMMPQVGMLKDLKNVKVDEQEITRVVAIIDSMTPAERGNHMIINGSRRRRIARGSGASVQEINQLLKQYSQARKMMKSLSGGFLGKKLGKMKLPISF